MKDEDEFRISWWFILGFVIVYPLILLWNWFKRKIGIRHNPHDISGEGGGPEGDYH
jgi:hypothetical protein